MKGRIAIAIVLAALVIFAGYAALFIAPDESTMHEVQRIFYLHVADWIRHVHCALRRICRKRRMASDAQHEMGLARRLRRGSHGRFAARSG